MASNNFGYGQFSPYDETDPVNAWVAMIRDQIAQMNTAKLVTVYAVNGGGVAPAGTVDVVPMVSQVDGNGNAVKHGIIHGIPWSRVQGGKNAIICDPVKGDFGYVVAMDRDITNVKTGVPSISQVTPGSARRFDIADGIYCGGALNVAPNQYLIFTATGIRLVDANGNSITMGATGMTLADINGNQIVMGVGSVNIITTALQVNGVPVTVP